MYSNSLTSLCQAVHGSHQIILSSVITYGSDLPLLYPNFSCTHTLTLRSTFITVIRCHRRITFTTFAVLFKCTLFLTLINRTALNTPFVSTPRFIQMVCSLSVWCCRVPTKSSSRLSLIRVSVASYRDPSSPSTRTLSPLPRLQRIFTLLLPAHLQRFCRTLLNHIVFNSNQPKCSSSPIYVQALFIRQPLSVWIIASETDQSLLTEAVLVTLSLFCALIYLTSFGIEIISSQRSRIYRNAIISCGCCSSGISLIVFIVSHGFSVR